MDYKRIADSIGSAIERRPTDIAAYTDLFSLLRSWEEVDFEEAHGRNKLLLNACAEKLREVSGKKLEQFNCAGGFLCSAAGKSAFSSL